MIRERATDRPAERVRIGCVSFLNAKPLIDGLDEHPELSVEYAVPSALLERLESGRVDVALCPVIDYQTSATPLEIVPAGGIGCDGPTMTVRLYSRGPIGRIASVAVDGDSHTSIALLRVLLAELQGVRPRLLEMGRSDAADNGEAGRSAVVAADAILLIGDKVVSAAPDNGRYPHQMDLGEAWKLLTDLPFVFAVWMARRGADLGPAPAILTQRRKANAGQIDRIVSRYAPSRSWPQGPANLYLGKLLRYAIGPRELEAMRRFWLLAHRHGVIGRPRELILHKSEAREPVAPAEGVAAEGPAV